MPSPVTAELRMQNSQFLSALNQSVGAVKKGADESVGRLGLLGRAAQDTFGKMGASSGVAGQAMALLGKTGGELGDAMAFALPAVAGVGLAVGVLGAGASKFNSLTAEVQKFKNASGASAEESSKMVAVAKELGIDTDALSTAMFRFLSSLQTAPQKMADLGVQIARTKGGNVDAIGTLHNLAAAYQASTDASVKDAIAKEVGQRGGLQLVAYLKAGTAALDQYTAAARARGEIFTDDDLQKGFDMRVAFRDLSQASTGLEISLSKGVVPAITDVTKALADGIDLVNRFKGDIAGAFVGHHDLSAPTNSKEWDVFFKHLKDGQDAATAAVAKYKTEVEHVAPAGAAQAAADLAAKDQALAAAVSTLDGALRSEVSTQAAASTAQQKLSQLEAQGAVDATAVADAERGVASAHRGVVDAQRGVTDAQRSLNDLLVKGKVDAEQVATAEKDLERSTRSTEDARKALADAEQHLQDVRQGATALDKREAEAQVRDAGTSLAEARQRLIELTASGTGTALDFQRAQEGVTDAQIAQARAVENRNKVVAEGTDGAPDTIAAQSQVESATRAVGDAVDAQNTAADNLRKAQAGDPNFDRNLADARQAVADASQHAADAQANEKDAADKLRIAQAGDPDFFHKLADAHAAVAQAAGDAAIAQAKAKDLIDQSQPAVDALRTNLDQIARDYPAAADFIAQIEATLPGGPSFALQDNRPVVPSAGLRTFGAGGWVDAPAGRAVPAIVHGGEFVVSQDMMRRGGGGGDNVINLALHIDGQKFAQATYRYTRDRIQQDRNRGGNV